MTEPQEAPVEEELPPSRYGIVLVLLFATFVFLASGPTGDWVPLVAVTLQGLTLLAALATSRVSKHLWRLAVVVIAIAFAMSVYALIAGGDTSRGVTFLLSLLLIGASPIVIAMAMVKRHVVDERTVLGALCIYVFIGMLWAFAFAALGALQNEPFFVQEKSATLADFLYYSFVTVTTVGYGDLTAAGGLGRAISVLEALVGQLYLVTVVSLLIGNMVRNRHPD